MSEMQSYDEQMTEIRRKAVTTATGWAPTAIPVPSSDWVGELEAALAHLMKAQNDLAKTQSPLWLESVPIGVWLRDAIASERGRSPTKQIRD
jgi:hypothetical protein